MTTGRQVGEFHGGDGRRDAADDEEGEMIDLSTRYLGLRLASPLVPSSSPLCANVDNMRAMEDAGAGAIVLNSLFAEQLDATSNVLELTAYNGGPDDYLEHIQRCKDALDIPIIASLNAVPNGRWGKFLRSVEEAGADAVELNLYYLPSDPLLTGAALEAMYIDTVRDVKETVSIPVAVKLGHAVTALPNFARQLDLVGVDALVLFNRFYLPDFDLERFDVTPRVTLSSPYEFLMRLHWVAILYGRIRADLAVSGGVHGSAQVLKGLLAGARVAMIASALLQNGIAYLSRVRADVIEWMDAHDYVAVTDLEGTISYQTETEPDSLERAGYMNVLTSYTPHMARRRAQ
jgi:dihydroorotate dehydrogenase (fumarate)